MPFIATGVRVWIVLDGNDTFYAVAKDAKTADQIMSQYGEGIRKTECTVAAWEDI